jgi:hypothetical protein
MSAHAYRSRTASFEGSSSQWPDTQPGAPARRCLCGTIALGNNSVAQQPLRVNPPGLRNQDRPENRKAMQGGWQGKAFPRLGRFLFCRHNFLTAPKNNSPRIAALSSLSTIFSIVLHPTFTPWRVRDPRFSSVDGGKKEKNLREGATLRRRG